MSQFMHRVFAAATLGLLASMGVPALAQSGGNVPIWVQQQNLQSLLNNAIEALRSDDQASACQLRSQALGLLNANIDAFLRRIRPTIGVTCKPRCREA